MIHLIGKDPALPDQPRLDVDLVGIHDDPRTHALLRGIRRVLDEYPGDRMMVGEVNLRDTIRIAAYHGAGDELHLAFNFLSLEAAFDPVAWRLLVRTVGESYAKDAWPTWVLSNHDNPRHRTRFGGGERRARAAAVLLLTLRGTPFLYQGEELGLEDARVGVRRRIDPGGRDGCRAPIPWTPGRDHGWPAPPLLPFPPGATAHSAERQEHHRSSMLHLYRGLLALRRASPALRDGGLRLVRSPAGVLRYVRELGDDRLDVAVNFSDRSVDLGSSARGAVVAASDDRVSGRSFDGTLPPESAVVTSARNHR